MGEVTIAAMREEYEAAGLDEADVSPDPVEQFRRWFEAAVMAELYEPNAMILATADVDGRPSARAVLLKGFDHTGFMFYTNYGSRKAIELASKPRAAAVFLWTQLHRQVRLEGLVEKVDPASSDAYFASRPRGAQLAASVSPQSQVIASRAILEQSLERLEVEVGDRSIDRPPLWGGYRIVPDEFEFWQGRPHRLHDRLRYRLSGDQWVIERLAP